MEKKSVMMALLLALTIAFTGCKKEDDNEPTIKYRTQGFVKGTLETTSSNGTAVKENFSYSAYPISNVFSYYFLSPDQLQPNDSIYNFSIYRSNYDNGGAISLKFSIDEITDKPEFIFFDYDFQKETNNTIYDFFITGSGTSEATITNFSFDTKTGRTKGNYTLKGQSTQSQKEGTVTGEFDVVLKRRVN